MNDGNEKKPPDVACGGKKQDTDTSPGAALGICFGCAFGLLVQILTEDVIWLPIGVAAGYGLGFAFGGTIKSGK